MTEKLINIVFFVVMVAGMAWFLMTRPSDHQRQATDCHIEYDGRSNPTVCE